jgi:hypothetical protein
VEDGGRRAGDRAHGITVRADVFSGVDHAENTASFLGYLYALLAKIPNMTDWLDAALA